MALIVRALVVASTVWPLLLGATVWQRVSGDRPWTSVVYLAASRICHQRTERSFHTAGVKWPVCARCTGLYLAAPIGAGAAVLWRRRHRRGQGDRSRVWLVVASVPTSITLGVEWIGLAEPSNIVRFLAALPLGALIAFVIVRTAAGPPRPIE